MNDIDLMPTAYALARRHRLVVEDGRARKIWCWNCGSHPALIPSLHCASCLAEAWRRTGAQMRCMNREQAPADVDEPRRPPGAAYESGGL